MEVIEITMNILRAILPMETVMEVNTLIQRAVNECRVEGRRRLRDLTEKLAELEKMKGVTTAARAALDHLITNLNIFDARKIIESLWPRGEEEGKPVEKTKKKD